jgi:hypothetical protein
MVAEVLFAQHIKTQDQWYLSGSRKYPQISISEITDDKDKMNDNFHATVHVNHAHRGTHYMHTMICLNAEGS